MNNKATHMTSNPQLARNTTHRITIFAAPATSMRPDSSDQQRLPVASGQQLDGSGSDDGDQPLS